MPKNKKKTRNILITLLIMVMVSLPSIGFAGTYWVSPTGTATWASCGGSTPLSGSSACSLAAANKNAVAGDIVYLRGGTYNTHIFPARSGTDASNRITYAAYSGEKPIIKNTQTIYGTYYHGILLGSRSYIKIDGVTVGPDSTMSRVLMITHGGSYNEISNCVIDGAGGGTVQIWKGNSALGPEYAAKFNWIHHTTIKNTGWVSTDCNDMGGMQIGVPGYDNVSGYQTIENNVFFSGGHHNLETFTKYNIIRNNVFHHEGSMTAPNPPCPYGPDTNGKYGNRNIQIYDGYNEDGKFNLIEGNRFGHSGPPPDDDGGDGFTLTAPKNIVRYNAIFNSQNNGVFFKFGGSSYSNNNRFYNNTIYKSGRYHNETIYYWQGANFRFHGASTYSPENNVIKNNIFYTFGGSSEWHATHRDPDTYNTITNNFCTNAKAGRCSANGNPLFVNPNVSDPFSLTLPNLNLQQGSKAIDGGIYLTQTKGFGNNSTTLVVDDALYFQDGSWGSSLARGVTFFPDWIAIRDVGNVGQIKSINYSTNTITLASPMTWSDRANIWLYKRSDGTRVIYGSAPDFGAYEFNSGDYQGIAPPQNPRPQ